MFKSGTPKPVIPHSFASPSVLSQVIIDKYVNHMPLYRQESEWKRLGLQLSRTTMANWIIIAAKEYFIPIVDRMHELMIQESHIHCDELCKSLHNSSPCRYWLFKSTLCIWATIALKYSSCSLTIQFAIVCLDSFSPIWLNMTSCLYRGRALLNLLSMIYDRSDGDAKLLYMTGSFMGALYIGDWTASLSHRSHV